MPQAIQALHAKVTGDARDFNAALASARRDLGSTEMKLKGFASVGSRAFASLGAAAGAAGLALGVGAITQGAMKFETAMNSVAAASGATAAELKSMREAARSLGMSTGEGAAATAVGIEELAKAGLAISDITGGALKAAITMAQATGSDIPTGATLAAKAMQIFGLEVSRMDDIVTQAAGVINTTTFGLEDYALGLSNAGGVAASVGVSFEDFNATLAAIAPLFSSGSDAGTALKTALLYLANPTALGAAKMEELGLNVRDASGKLLAMDEIGARLAASMEGLTDAQKANALVAIFGADAMRAGIGIMNEAGGTVRRYRDEIIPMADANKMAQARFAGLEGQVASLKAAWQDFTIAIGDTGWLSALAGVVRSAGAELKKLAEYIGDVQWRLSPAGTAAMRDGANWRNGAYVGPNNARAAAPRPTVIGSGIDDGFDPDARRTGLGVRMLRGPGAARAANPADAAAEAAKKLAEDLEKIVGGGSGGGGGSGRGGALAVAVVPEIDLTSIGEGSSREADWLADMQRDLEALAVPIPLIPFIDPLGDAIEAESQAMAETLIGGLRDAFVNGDGIEWDDIANSLKRSWKSVLWEAFLGEPLRDLQMNLARSLRGILTDCFGNGGGSGDGGFFKTAFKAAAAIFGGGRAAGGAVSAGRVYRVNETQDEYFAASGGGSIMSLGQASRMAANTQPGAVVHQTTVHVHAKDAVLAETVKGWVMEAAAAGASGGRAMASSDTRRRNLQRLR